MSPSLELVRSALATRPEIALAAAFGSVPAGRATASSDLDLAVRFEPGREPHGWEYGGLVAALEGALGRRVDLVDLERAQSTVLRMEIAKGQLLKGEPDEWVRFKVRAFRDWRDFGPRFRRLARAAGASRGGAAP